MPILDENISESETNNEEEKNDEIDVIYIRNKE